MNVTSESSNLFYSRSELIKCPLHGYYDMYQVFFLLIHGHLFGIPRFVYFIA